MPQDRQLGQARLVHPPARIGRCAVRVGDRLAPVLNSERGNTVEITDPLTIAYIECALWSSGDDEHESFDVFDFDDLAPEALEQAILGCQQFASTYADEIATRSDSAAGHDLWLTRNGHGAGFWDGDWPEPAATILDRAAKALGETNLYLGDDGKLYFV